MPLTIVQRPTKNFITGRGGFKPEVIVIHVMAGTLSGTDSWFASGSAVAGNPVSAHYGVGLSGEVHQYVAEKDTAWHAGRIDRPSFKLYKTGVNPNLYTIGIEHEGNADTVWTPEMKGASARLIMEISARWNIPIDRDHVIGHYQIFASKPFCPATNKGIIDELIALANPTAPPAFQPDVKGAIDLLTQALRKLTG